jgi:transglycosylase-like protein with SLT domain/uncharacterized protein DUF4124
MDAGGFFVVTLIVRPHVRNWRIGVALLPGRGADDVVVETVARLLRVGWCRDVVRLPFAADLAIPRRGRDVRSGRAASRLCAPDRITLPGFPTTTGREHGRIVTSMRCRGRLLSVLLCVMAPAVACADIYTFTDAAGVTHYSNVPNDSRYARFIAEPLPSVVGGKSEWRTRAASYSALIEEAAHHAGVDAALLRAVIAVESAFDPGAVSSKGAQGLMQLRPTTARRYGVSRPLDPRENLRGGASYIRDLLKRYGNDLELALAAYNAGEDAVDRHGHTIPPFPETRAYVPAVLRLYRRFREARVKPYL